MTAKEVISCALELPGAEADCPFDGDYETTVFRHGVSRRWFGILLRVPEKHFGTAERALNVKAPPELIPLLRKKYAGLIFPAYHMNRTHWLTVRLSAGEVLIGELLRLSYDLTDKNNGRTQKA